MSHGVVSPLSRIVPAQGLLIDGSDVPPGTNVSTAAPFIHRNHVIFPNPETFNPDRWLGGGTVGSRGEEEGLAKYLVPFSRGPRQCLGIKYIFFFFFSILNKLALANLSQLVTVHRTN